MRDLIKLRKSILRALKVAMIETDDLKSRQYLMSLHNELIRRREEENA